MGTGDGAVCARWMEADRLGLIEAIADLLRGVLIWLDGVTKSSGLAIILLTLAIRAVLYPFTLSQTRQMAVMRELQPKLQELQKKYKDKPQELQKRMIELYREHKINPFGGCLPLLIQLPFLWALFWVLRDFPESLNPNFLIWNLAEEAKDPLYILPILAGVTTYIQMMMAMTDPSQKLMMTIMPIFIGWLSVQFPAGLVLYWTVSNIFSIGQQYLINQQMAAAKSQEGAKKQ